MTLFDDLELASDPKGRFEADHALDDFGRFPRSGLIGADELSAELIEKTLQTARLMKSISERAVKKAPTLRGRTIINLFMEPSTRTRTSFEIAAKRLSADLINVSAASSSMSKGETFKDTLATLTAMRPDLLVIRSPYAGAPALAGRWISTPIINAGDGRHEHPSQALLDLMSIQERKGSLAGLNMTIVGDIANSRVARSNLIMARKVGIKTTLVAPPTLTPPRATEMADRVLSRFDSASVDQADVIMALRIQHERIAGGAFPSLDEYARLYQINRERLANAKDDLLILHPGPVNRDIEISTEMIERHKGALMLDQVENGVAVRMALFYLILGAPTEGGR